MARKKGSLNKKIKDVSLEKNDILQEKEPIMTTAVLDDIQTEIDLARQELETAKKEIEERKLELAKMTSNVPIVQEKKVEVSVRGNALKEKIQAQKDYDNVLVTGRFMNRRSPGQPVKLPYIKYEDDPVKWHPFIDGGTYTIPRGFADQINEYYHTPKFTQKQGEIIHSSTVGENSTIAEVDTSNKKYSFVPINF